jgi:hypothetical protein
VEVTLFSASTFNRAEDRQCPVVGFHVHCTCRTYHFIRRHSIPCLNSSLARPFAAHLSQLASRVAMFDHTLVGRSCSRSRCGGSRWLGAVAKLGGRPLRWRAPAWQGATRTAVQSHLRLIALPSLASVLHPDFPKCHPVARRLSLTRPYRRFRWKIFFCWHQQDHQYRV